MENYLSVFLFLTLLSTIISVFILYNIYGRISFIEPITKQRFSVKILNNKNNIKIYNFILVALMPLFNIAYTVIFGFTLKNSVLITSLLVGSVVILNTLIACLAYIVTEHNENYFLHLELARLFIFSPIFFLFLPVIYIGFIIHTVYSYFAITKEDLEYNLLMLPMKDIESVVYNAYRNNNQKAIKDLNEIAKYLIKHFKLFTLDSELGVENNNNLNSVFYRSFDKTIDYTFTAEQLLIIFERSKYLENKTSNDFELELSCFGLLDTYEYLLYSRIEPIKESNQTIENYIQLEKLVSEFKQENLDLIIRKELHEIKFDAIKSFKDYLQFNSNFEKIHKEKFENLKGILPKQASLKVFNELVQEVINTKGFKEVLELPADKTLDTLIDEDNLNSSDIYEIFLCTRILNGAISAYYNDVLPEDLFSIEFIKIVDSKY